MGLNLSKKSRMSHIRLIRSMSRQIICAKEMRKQPFLNWFMRPILKYVHRCGPSCEARDVSFCLLFISMAVFSWLENQALYLCFFD